MPCASQAIGITSQSGPRRPKAAQNGLLLHDVCRDEGPGAADPPLTVDKNGPVFAVYRPPQKGHPGLQVRVNVFENGIYDHRSVSSGPPQVI